MSTKPLTDEAIALTEKKMDMTLDDIIKMSKNNTVKPRKQRVSNRSKKFVNNVAHDKAAKIQRFMDTRSTVRQGVLAQRRSNFQGNQFPFATEAARKATALPIRKPFNGTRTGNMNKPRVGAPIVQKRAVNNEGNFNMKGLVPFGVQQFQQQVKVPPKQKPQTLDSLFANMKEERMRIMSQQNNPGRRNGGGQRLPPWQRGRFGK